MKTIQLKLGMKCNLHCAYCHNVDKPIALNPDIYDFLAGMPALKKIRFSGGEPLLYKDLINSVMDRLEGRDILFQIVTNGTLLDDETVEWLNRRNINIGLSFDGFKNLRGAVPDFEQVKKLECCGGISCVVSKGFNYNQYFADVSKAMEICGKNLISKPNFIHQTVERPNLELVDEETVNNYIRFICEEIEFEANLMRKGYDRQYLRILGTILVDTVQMEQLGERRGVRCCNEHNIGLSINGKFYLCNYGLQEVGDIYKGVDWDKLEAAIPAHCRTCEYWKYCRCTCVANVTRNECRISRATLNKLKELKLIK